MSTRKIRKDADDLGTNEWGSAQDIADLGYGSLLPDFVNQIDRQLLPNGASLTSPDGSQITIGSIRVSTTGAVFSGTEEYQWKLFFDLIRQVNRAIQWIIGDWAAYGKDALNWSYEDMAALTGYKQDSIIQYAYVARNVSPSIRIDVLSFGHHQVVAAMPELLQKQWLEKARLNRWGVRTLQQQIGTSPTPSGNPLLPPASKQAFNRIWRYLDKGVGEVNADDIATLRRWLDTIEGYLE